MRLCQVSADVTRMTGAGVMLMTGDVRRGSLCTTDAVSAAIEQLQYDLGEGPCVDAYQEDRPVLEPDLAHPSSPRWPGFSDLALTAGAGAVFGFPLRVGPVRLGALNLYSRRPCSLTSDQHADALVLAAVVAQAILVMQAEAPAGAVAAGLELDANFQDVVHQAAGMVSVQLGVSVGRALVRLRAHAFGNEQPLHEVAEAVVTRRLRFHPEPGETDSGP